MFGLANMPNIWHLAHLSHLLWVLLVIAVISLNSRLHGLGAPKYRQLMMCESISNYLKSAHQEVEFS